MIIRMLQLQTIVYGIRKVEKKKVESKIITRMV